MNPLPVAQRERVREALRRLGFDVVRFAAADRRPDDTLAAWLAAGYHADMAWMERTAAKRSDPQLVLGGCRTIIVLGVNYGPGDAPTGPWARYALYSDYHDSIGAALKKAGAVLAEETGATPEEYLAYVDAGPVRERGWASAAGVGFAGKNGNLIARDFGNWLFLASILTRLDFPPDAALGPPRPGSAWPAPALGCGKCTRCLDACPTAAFPAPGIVDARRCISYHTIENRGVIPRELRPRFGARLFGCDVCLEVCPWNRFAQAARSELLERRTDFGRLRLLEILQLTEERFRAVFSGTAIKRTKHTGLVRNACIAAGNVWRAGGPEPGTDFLPTFAAAGEREAAVIALQALVSHPAAVVRAHAVWALARVLGPTAATTLAATRAAEPDSTVLSEYTAAGMP